MDSFDATFNSLQIRFEQEKQPLSPVTLGAINKDGSFRYVKGFNQEGTDPNNSDSVYLIASATKLVTTVAVMQCVERGQLSLDDDITAWLPEWKKPNILTGFDSQSQPIFKPAEKAITVRHLLTHSSGMAYIYSDPLALRYQELHGPPIPSPAPSVASKFPHPFLLFEPGSRWMYGPSIDWAGLLLERLTAQKLGDYMHHHIFSPVSATVATFHPERDPAVDARKAKVWERVGDTIKQQTPEWWPKPMEYDFGGGGLWATVDDLLKVYQGVLAGTLLRPETVKQMFTPQLATPPVGLDNPAGEHTGTRNAIWNSIPDDVPVSFGLGGVLNTAAVKGRRGANSLTWSGLPNCYWVSPVSYLVYVNARTLADW